MLTDLMTKTWSGMTTREHRKFKDLKKENLRDNMTNTELVLNMLAEVAATDISVEREPSGFHESAQAAKEGTEVAKGARGQLEQRTGKKAVSPLNTRHLGQRVIESKHASAKRENLPELPVRSSMKNPRGDSNDET